jgi:hypothetical protein
MSYRKGTWLHRKKIYVCARPQTCQKIQKVENLHAFAGRVPDYVEKKNGGGGGTHMCGCSPISEGIFSVHEQ